MVPKLERPPLTFRDFSRDWQQTYVLANNRLSERLAKASILRKHLVPRFGSVRLDRLTTEHIERYKVLKLEEGLSAKTINNHLTVLAKCLRSASSWGDWHISMPQIQKLKTTSQRLDFLSYDESARLLADDEEPMWCDMIGLALDTGMRRGELIALDWQDVDLERRLVTVRRSFVAGVIGPTKSNRERRVPLSASALARLTRRLPRRSGLVFSRADGAPVAHKSMEGGLRRATARAGIRYVSWHVLRHTFASQLASEGVPIPTVKELLGHSSITTTMLYAHLAPTALRDAVDQLERARAARPWATGGQHPTRKDDRSPRGLVVIVPKLSTNTDPRRGLEVVHAKGFEPLTLSV